MTQVWPLPFSVNDEIVKKAGAVKMVIFDVDGILTEGVLTYGPEGGEYKSFNVRDGHGMKLLMDNGVEVAVLSARSSRALTTRIRELGIRHAETGATDKQRGFESILKRCALDEDQCCYVGDDLPDIPIMNRCGLAITVADAHHTVRHIAEWVTPSPGGRGAAREVCDLVLYSQGKFDDIMDRSMSSPATP